MIKKCINLILTLKHELKLFISNMLINIKQRQYKRVSYIAVWGAKISLLVSVLFAVITGGIFIFPWVVNTDDAKNLINEKLHEEFPQLQINYQKISYHVFAQNLYDFFPPQLYIQIEDVKVLKKSKLLVSIPKVNLLKVKNNWKVNLQGAHIIIPASALQVLAAQSEGISTVSIKEQPTIELSMQNTHWTMEDIDVVLKNADIQAQLHKKQWKFGLQNNEKNYQIDVFATGNLNDSTPISVRTKFKNTLPLSILPIDWKGAEGVVDVVFGDTIFFRGQGTMAQAIIQTVTADQLNWQAVGQFEANVTAIVTLNLSAQNVKTAKYSIPDTYYLMADLHGGGHWQDWLSELQGSYAMSTDNLSMVLGSTVSVATYLHGDFLFNGLQWQSQIGQINVISDDLNVNATASIAGDLYSIDSIALQATINNTDLGQLHHYIAEGNVHDYFSKSVKQGEITQGHIGYYQNITSTVLLLTAGFSGGVLAIDDWPLAKGLFGILIVDENNLSIEGEGAFVNSYVNNVVARIDDVYNSDATLNLNIDVKQGRIEDYFSTAIKIPPIADAINQATDIVVSTVGLAKLNLQIDLPLSDLDNVEVKALLEVKEAHLRTGEELPLMVGHTGVMKIENNQFNGRAVGYLDDGYERPLTVTFNDQAHIQAQGRVKSSLAMSVVDITSTLVTGDTLFQLDITPTSTVVFGTMVSITNTLITGSIPFNIKIESTLTMVLATLSDTGINLPYPLSKTDKITAILSVRMYDDVKQVAYTTPTISVLMYLSDSRSDIGINESTLSSPKPHGYIHGKLDYFNMDDWLALGLDNTSNGNNIISQYPLSEIDMQLSNVQVFGLQTQQASVQITASGNNLTIGDWLVMDLSNTINSTTTVSQNSLFEINLQLSSVQILGLQTPQASVQITISDNNQYNILIKDSPDVKGQLKISDTLLQASLSYLTLPITLSKNAQEGKGFLDGVTVSLVINEFNVSGLTLGRLEIYGQPDKEDWLLDKLELSKDSNTLSISGRYHHDSATTVEVALISDFVPNLLNIINITPVISEGMAMVHGTVSWSGELLDLTLPSMQGQLTLSGSQFHYNDVSFTSELVDLLDSLSLQSLLQVNINDDGKPRVQLGIKAVGKPGIHFESLNGDILIANGYVYLENVALSSDTVDVNINGKTDFIKREHDLYGRVLPGKKLISAGSTASIGLGALEPVTFIAGFLLGKIFEKPLSQIGSYNYKIIGAWDDPEYIEEKIDSSSATPIKNPNTLDR